MEEPQKPANEPERLAALHRLDILDTPAEERFDRITRLARRIFDVPVALVSLVDDDRQWFKSTQGLLINETPRVLSLCAHAILGHDTLVVRDATKDPRFYDNPLVVGEPFLRFYAGEALRTPEGAAIGTLCLIDSRPRDLTGDDLQILKDLGGWAASELRVAGLSARERELLKSKDQLERQSFIDGVTRVWSRRAISEIVPKELTRALREGSSVAVAIVGLDSLKTLAETQGPRACDVVLREVAQRIRASVRTYDIVGRHEGEQFLVLLPSCETGEAKEVANRIRARIEASTIAAAGVSVGVGAFVGLACGPVATGREPFVRAAEHALQRAFDGTAGRVESVPVF